MTHRFLSILGGCLPSGVHVCPHSDCQRSQSTLFLVFLQEESNLFWKTLPLYPLQLLAFTCKGITYVKAIKSIIRRTAASILRYKRRTIMGYSIDFSTFLKIWGKIANIQSIGKGRKEVLHKLLLGSKRRTVLIVKNPRIKKDKEMDVDGSILLFSSCIHTHNPSYCTNQPV